ncbi:alpha/beta-hydrolase [Cucurbitaria berberidis CBS 394.84]|uniref:Alpha/beta-hydrolase n=1 Tax=Cucurbitaria berberidis CBS 394.84 TaxID=1168544 RepID=A0A9P4GGY2_9PLEO|nr:alpha/beta-hydrolase [Cucurbitaria berberidis CBS 394.84]KAF1845264.1 alpha/beta-hydrolase [Cucurbitaria berberidis CBS 394.84]
MPSFVLETDHGLISITDTGLKNDKPALLLIHGNSSSSKIFRHILESKALTERWRIIAFDLPGHGASSNAPDPDKTYWMRGYADLAMHILQHLNIPRVVVFGWSLGGHVGIEMVPLLASISSPPIEIKGLMLTGTPPALGKEQMKRGFKFQDGDLGLAGKKDWSEEEAQGVARYSAAAGKEECFEAWMLEDARRTDGRARVIMSRRLAGNESEAPAGVDQRKVVETEEVLIAVVNGGAEQFVNLDYLDDLRWRRLWRGRCIALEGLKHAPFWERPDEFEGLLLEFMGDCEKEV